MMKTTQMALRDVRAQLSEIVTTTESEHAIITITKNGRPAAVLMSFDDYEGIQETLDILGEPDTMAGLRESEISGEHGFYYTMDEVWDGKRLRPSGEAEAMVRARMGDAYDAARAAIREDLLRDPDANVRVLARGWE